MKTLFFSIAVSTLVVFGVPYYALITNLFTISF